VSAAINLRLAFANVVWMPTSVWDVAA